MERIKIDAIPRKKGTNNNALRRKGYLPAVVYGREINPVLISLEAPLVRKVIKNASGANIFFDLNMGGDADSPETVMLKELHKHPLQGDLLLHADLIRISLIEKMEISVPLNIMGEPEGVRDGGVLQIQLREIRVKCLPDDMPQFIDISVDNMKVGDLLTVNDLTLSSTVELLERPGEVIASVTSSAAAAETPSQEADAGSASADEATAPSQEATEE